MATTTACNFLQLPSFTKTPNSCSNTRALNISNLPSRFLTTTTTSSPLSTTTRLGIIPAAMGYNVQIMVDEGEPEEVLLRRFRREVSKSGVIQESKRRRYFENSQEEKKRKTREAGKRKSRRRWAPRVPTPGEDDGEAMLKKAEDSDNWDMPQGNLPYST